MGIRKGLPVLVLVAGLLVLAAGNSAAAEPVAGEGRWVMPFQAYTPDGTTLKYTGDYTVEHKAGQIREVQAYRNLEGKVVHRIESVWDDAQRRPISYLSEDLTNGVTATVKFGASGLDYEVRDVQAATPKSGHRDQINGTYVWPNLVTLVQANWDTVLAGKPLPVEIFFASLGNTIAVEVVKDGPSTLDGVSVEQFKVVAANGFVKLIMSPIKLVFSNNGSKRLVRFEGRSVVADNNRKILDLRIVFGEPRES